MKNSIPVLFPLRSLDHLLKGVIELREWFRLDHDEDIAKGFAKTRSPKGGSHPQLKGKSCITQIGDDGVRQPLVPPKDGHEEFGLMAAGEIVTTVNLPKTASRHNVAVWAYLASVEPTTPVILKWQ